MALAVLTSLADTRTILQGAGAKNGGVIVNIAHVINNGVTFDEVGRIPPNQLIRVELNDGTPPNSPRYDPTGQRQFCGEGEFDVRGLIAAVAKTGFIGPRAVEVFGGDFVAVPQNVLNERAFMTTMAQFRSPTT